MNKHELTDLVRRLREGTASQEEKSRLEQFWQEALNDSSHLDSMPETERAALKNEIHNATRTEIERIEQSRQRARRLWAWRVAAAFALLRRLRRFYIGTRADTQKYTPAMASDTSFFFPTGRMSPSMEIPPSATA